MLENITFIEQKFKLNSIVERNVDNKVKNYIIENICVGRWNPYLPIENADNTKCIYYCREEDGKAHAWVTEDELLTLNSANTDYKLLCLNRCVNYNKTNQVREMRTDIFSLETEKVIFNKNDVFDYIEGYVDFSTCINKNSSGVPIVQFHGMIESPNGDNIRWLNDFIDVSALFKILKKICNALQNGEIVVNEHLHKLIIEDNNILNTLLQNNVINANYEVIYEAV